MNTKSTLPTVRRRTPDLLKLIPEQHRLPGLLFVLLEGIFLALAFRGSENVRLGVILGMVIIAVVFFLRFFARTENRALATGVLEGASNSQELADTETMQLLMAFDSLRSDRCPLFAKAAANKFRELTSFVAELRSDRMEVRSTFDVADALEFLFCEVELVQEIYASSLGELLEWREEKNWWMTNYLRMQEKAIAQGKTIRRIFIVQNEAEKAAYKDVFQKNKDRGIDVRIALQDDISGQDLQEGGNCILFCRRGKDPVYCLQARHSAQGEFEKAIFYRDGQHIEKLVDAYKRIDANAKRY